MELNLFLEFIKVAKRISFQTTVQDVYFFNSSEESGFLHSVYDYTDFVYVQYSKPCHLY